MPFVYIPYPDDHERAGAVREAYHPTGVDLQEVCARCGWYASPPSGVAIYNRDGNLDPTTAEYVRKPKPVEPEAAPEEAPVEPVAIPARTRRITKEARSDD